MANYTFDKLERYLKQKAQDMEKGTARALFELSSDIVERTPVDEGFAKGSWTAGINKTSIAFNSSNGVPTPQIKAESNKFKLGDSFYLLSNLVYMPVLEFGRYGTGAGATSKTTRDGFSTQAPNGMVRTAIDNFQQNLEEAIKNEQ